MRVAPQWVQDLVLRVALDENQDALPEVVWRHGRGGGRAYASGRLVLSVAGRPRRAQKLVLLHELAHWLNPKQHHSSAFWDTAWRLYRRYKVPVRYAARREGHYRAGALVAARRAGVRATKERTR